MNNPKNEDSSLINALNEDEVKEKSSKKLFNDLLLNIYNKILEKNKIYSKILFNNYNTLYITLLGIYFTLCANIIQPTNLIKNILNITIFSGANFNLMILFLVLLGVLFYQIGIKGKIDYKKYIHKFILYLNKDKIENIYFTRFLDYIFNETDLITITFSLIFISIIIITINFPGTVGDKEIGGIFGILISSIIPIIFCLLFITNKLIEFVDIFINKNIKDDDFDENKLKCNVIQNKNKYFISNNVLLFLMAGIPMHTKNIFTLESTMLIFIASVFSNNIPEYLEKYSNKSINTGFIISSAFLEAAIYICTTALSCSIIYSNDIPIYSLIICISYTGINYRYFLAPKYFYYKMIFDKFKKIGDDKLKNLYVQVIKYNEKDDIVKVNSGGLLKNKDYKLKDFKELINDNDVNVNEIEGKTFHCNLNKLKFSDIDFDKILESIDKIMDDILDNIFENNSKSIDNNIDFILYPKPILIDLLTTKFKSPIKCYHNSDRDEEFQCKNCPSRENEKGETYCDDHFSDKKTENNYFYPMFCHHKNCIKSVKFYNEIFNNKKVIGYNYFCTDHKDEIDCPLSIDEHIKDEQLLITKIINIKSQFLKFYNEYNHEDKNNTIKILELLIDCVDHELILLIINEINRLNHHDYTFKICKNNISEYPIEILNKLKLIQNMEFNIYDKNNKKSNLNFKFYEENDKGYWEFNFSKTLIEYFLNIIKQTNIFNIILQQYLNENKIKTIENFIFTPVITIKIYDSDNNDKFTEILLSDYINDESLIKTNKSNIDSFKEFINATKKKAKSEIDLVQKIYNDDLLQVRLDNVFDINNKFIESQLSSIEDNSDFNILDSFSHIKFIFQRFKILKNITVSSQTNNINNKEEATECFKKITLIFDKLIRIFITIFNKRLEILIQNKMSDHKIFIQNANLLKTEISIGELKKFDNSSLIFLIRYIFPFISLKILNKYISKLQEKYIIFIENKFNKQIEDLDDDDFKKENELPKREKDMADLVKHSLDGNSIKKNPDLRNFLNEFLNILLHILDPMCAIVGGTNNGKTSIINALTGRKSSSVSFSSETSMITKIILKRHKDNNAPEHIVINMCKRIFQIVINFIDKEKSWKHNEEKIDLLKLKEYINFDNNSFKIIPTIKNNVKNMKCIYFIEFILEKYQDKFKIINIHDFNKDLKFYKSGKLEDSEFYQNIIKSDESNNWNITKLFRVFYNDEKDLVEEDMGNLINILKEFKDNKIKNSKIKFFERENLHDVDKITSKVSFVINLALRKKNHEYQESLAKIKGKKKIQKK